jgi:8-oxo-dGTP pyrophosphatase MutT (NUDIX family)
VSAAFDLPQERVFDFDSTELALLPDPHPYELENADAIEAHWAVETARNPALFDGRVIMLTALVLEGGCLRGRGHEVRFASFMHWRARRPDPRAYHCFANSVLVGSDGAVVAVRMGAHTANPGKVYFAAGSFEVDDAVAGHIVPELNMRREVGEETGLDLGAAAVEPGWHGWSGAGRTVIFRRFRFAETAEQLAGRIRVFVASEGEPEIEGPVIIRRPDDLPLNTVPHMAPMLAWHFSQPM